MEAQLVGRLVFKVLLVFHCHIMNTSKKNSPGIYPELDYCYDPRPLFSIMEEELGNTFAKYATVIEMWKTAKVFYEYQRILTQWDLIVTKFSLR